MRKSTPISPVPRMRKPDPEAGPGSAGQSGDTQGLSDQEDVENESVRELAEEGQYFEASLVDAIENAPPADAGAMRPRGRAEDDLPPEYAEQPTDEPKE
jgi:hypothetical protein